MLRLLSHFQKLAVAALLLVLVGWGGSSLAVAQEAKSAEGISSDQLEISFRSRHPNKVDLAFFSQDRSVGWPGDNQVYNLYDDKVHSFTLNCQPGERICWGAAVRRKPNQGYGNFWGAGIDGKEACDRCCLTCGNLYNTEILDP